MGMIVDMVEEVSQYTEAEIEPTPDFGSLVDTRYITGMTKTKGTVKTLLDLDKRSQWTATLTCSRFSARLPSMRPQLMPAYPAQNTGNILANTGDKKC